MAPSCVPSSTRSEDIEHAHVNVAAGFTETVRSSEPFANTFAELERVDLSDSESPFAGDARILIADEAAGEEETAGAAEGGGEIARPEPVDAVGRADRELEARRIEGTGPPLIIAVSADTMAEKSGRFPGAGSL